MRELEKAAVAAGGGTNHRMGLYDAVMIKENHAAVAGGLAAATRKAVAEAPEGVEVCVECEAPEDVDIALEAGARRLLLDNMTPGRARRVRRPRRRPRDARGLGRHHARERARDRGDRASTSSRSAR